MPLHDSLVPFYLGRLCLHAPRTWTRTSLQVSLGQIEIYPHEAPSGIAVPEAFGVAWAAQQAKWTRDATRYTYPQPLSYPVVPATQRAVCLQEAYQERWHLWQQTPYGWLQLTAPVVYEQERRAAWLSLLQVAESYRPLVASRGPDRWGAEAFHLPGGVLVQPSAPDECVGVGFSDPSGKAHLLLSARVTHEPVPVPRASREGVLMQAARRMGIGARVKRLRARSVARWEGREEVLRVRNGANDETMAWWYTPGQTGETQAPRIECRFRMPTDEQEVWLPVWDTMLDRLLPAHEVGESDA